MNKKFFDRVCLVCLVMAMCLLFFNQRNALATGRIVYIYGYFQEDKSDTRVEPKIISIKRETTLIFLNESQVEVRIIFPEGKTCDLATHAEPGWNMKGKCYITKHTIPPGGTSSMYFNSIGTFDYEVEYIGKDRKEKASIRVSSHPGYRW